MSRMYRKRSLSVLLALFLIASLLAAPLAALAAPAGQVTTETEALPLATGVRYSAYRVATPEYNEAIKVLTVDPGDKYTVLETALSLDNLARDQERPTAMAARLARPGRAAVAATNGDFYSTQPPYLPIGLQIRNGELLTNPEGFPALGLTAAGEVFIGTPVLTASLAVTIAGPDKGSSVTQKVYSYPITAINRPRGADMLVLYTPAYAASTDTNDYGSEIIVKDVDLPLKAGRTYNATVDARIDGRGNNPIPAGGIILSGHGRAQEFLQQLNPGARVSITLQFSDRRWNEVVQAIGGHEIILQDGQVALPLDSKDPLVYSRHPRTAVGITKDGRLEIVVADGRQNGYSHGVTLFELAEFMRGRGIVTALNLDGGGSSVLAARDAGEYGLTIFNNPAGGQERPVTNGLLVFSTAPKGKLGYLYLEPVTARVYQGSRVRFSLKAQDEYYNPAPVPASIKWQVDGKNDLGRFVAPGIFLAGQPGTETVVARSGKVQAQAEVTVVDKIDRLVLTPATALLEPGAGREFTVRAYDTGGSEVYVDPSLYHWTVSPDLGRIDPQTGRLAVTGRMADGQVKVRLGDQEAVAVINPVLELAVADQAVAGRAVPLVVTHNGAPVAGAAVVVPAIFGQVTASALYLRKGPGTGYQHLALLPRDTALTVLKRLDNGWLQVRVNDGRQGFVCGDYVNTWEGVESLGLTDAAGRVAFSAAIPGRYTFEARKEGYLPGTLIQEFKGE